MKEMTLKEVSRLLNVSMFILVEFFKELELDIKLEDAFSFDKVPREMYQKALNNRIILKQLQILRFEELNHKIKFLKSKPHSLGDMSGSQEDFEISREFIANELKKTESLIQLIKKQREQVEQYIDSQYNVRPRNLNNTYYLYNATGFVMQVNDLDEAREQAKQFKCIIKDISNNTVR